MVSRSNNSSSTAQDYIRPNYPLLVEEYIETSRSQLKAFVSTDALNFYYLTFYAIIWRIHIVVESVRRMITTGGEVIWNTLVSPAFVLYQKTCPAVPQTQIHASISFFLLSQTSTQ